MSVFKPGRRDLLGLAAMAGVAPGALAATPLQEAVPEVVDLWPGAAPGGESVSVTEQVILRNPGGDPTDTAFLNVTRPWLMVRRPVVPNGAAVLIIPGGGFQRVAVSKAGGAIDRWLATQGYTAFVMNYRLPADGWAAGADVSLQDAQRAMRLIRSRAAELGIDPDRVAVLGFSAGGYVAARLATQHDRVFHDAIDPVDALSARPTLAGLFFPVVTMMEPYAHAGSLRQLLGAEPSSEARSVASAEQHVTADTPPTFIASAADDPVVPVENSLMMWRALRASRIATEMHLFETGGHSLGGMNPTDPKATWPVLISSFLSRHGV